MYSEPADTHGSSAVASRRPRAHSGQNSPSVRMGRLGKISPVFSTTDIRSSDN